ncbi:MAG: ORF6N domain-containing protein [Clostridium sp.]|nr:ORF6N domain-containing protein [Clostridium sp.]
MNEITETEKIENMIYEIRGKQVMLDYDLARLYECKNGTKSINQAVKRNLNKFPERYMFKLTEEEFNIICGPNLGPQKSKTRTLPYVFTEQGVAMLATILRTSVADIVSMKIIDAFVYMRKYLTYNNKDSLILNHEERILKLEESFNKLSAKQNSIIYEGCIYDSYSLLLDILNEAYEEIIIFDNYANKELFDILKNINKKIYVISKNLDNILINKYSKQYSNVTFINNDLFHDRYIILDRKTVYVSGMSLKDLGKKYSYMYKMNEKIFINDLVSRIEILL